MKTYIQSDSYFNKPEKYDIFGEMGNDVVPIDVYGGFVPQEKEGRNNIKTNQETIRKRFNLDN